MHLYLLISLSKREIFQGKVKAMLEKRKMNQFNVKFLNDDIRPTIACMQSQGFCDEKPVISMNLAYFFGLEYEGIS